MPEESVSGVALCARNLALAGYDRRLPEIADNLALASSLALEVVVVLLYWREALFNLQYQPNFVGLYKPAANFYRKPKIYLFEIGNVPAVYLHIQSSAVFIHRLLHAL